MRPRPRAGLTAVCLLASALGTGCASPTVHTSGVWYTCCSDGVTSTRWHPGQQLVVTWTRTSTVPPGHSFEPVTLSAVLTGPYSDAAAALKAAPNRRSGADVWAAAPQVRISRNPARSPVSIIAIPASAPPGVYNLQTSVSAGGGTVTGVGTVSVG